MPGGAGRQATHFRLTQWRDYKPGAEQDPIASGGVCGEGRRVTESSGRKAQGRGSFRSADSQLGLARCAGGRHGRNKRKLHLRPSREAPRLCWRNESSSWLEVTELGLRPPPLLPLDCYGARCRCGAAGSRERRGQGTPGRPNEDEGR